MLVLHVNPIAKTIMYLFVIDSSSINNTIDDNTDHERRHGEWTATTAGEIVFFSLKLEWSLVLSQDNIPLSFRLLLTDAESLQGPSIVMIISDLDCKTIQTQITLLYSTWLCILFKYKCSLLLIFSKKICVFLNLDRVCYRVFADAMKNNEFLFFVNFHHLF